MSATPDRVDDAVLDDLRHRLRATRTVPLAGPAGWARGTDAGYLSELVDYWQDGYDWRAHEDRLRALPWGRRRRERRPRYPCGAAAHC